MERAKGIEPFLSCREHGLEDHCLTNRPCPHWRTVWELNPSREFEGLVTSPKVERFVLLPTSPARNHATCVRTRALASPGDDILLTTSNLLKSAPRSPVAMPARLLQKSGAPPESRTRKIRFLRPARMPFPPAGRRCFQNKKPGDLAVQSGLVAAMRPRRTYILNLSQIAYATHESRSNP